MQKAFEGSYSGKQKARLTRNTKAENIVIDEQQFYSGIQKSDIAAPAYHTWHAPCAAIVVKQSQPSFLPATLNAPNRKSGSRFNIKLL